jgi:hypothetical protein
MPRPKRANGAGAVYTKHCSYYGRWVTSAGRTNRRLGPVRRPGTSSGLTRTQAEKRLREADEPSSRAPRAGSRPTMGLAGGAFTEHLQALGRSKSHIEYRLSGA